MKLFYLVMCILGTLLPLSFFVPWLMTHGLDITAFIEQITTSNIGAFAWADVLVSAIVVIGLIIIEGSRSNLPDLWIPILATLCIGPSLGLPLFLLLREKHFERNRFL